MPKCPRYSINVDRLKWTVLPPPDFQKANTSFHKSRMHAAFQRKSTPVPNHHHGMMIEKHNHHDDDCESKLAYTACLDALKTLMEYLRKEMGIQLQLRPDKEDLLRILQRAHDYVNKSLESNKTDATATTNNGPTNATTCSILLLSCWKSVYTYTAVSHGRSWRNLQHFKHFMALQQKQQNQNHQKQFHHDDNNAMMIDQALQTMIRYAEDCSTCQRQVFLLQRKCRQLPER
jgi:hypothetical protein